MDHLELVASGGFATVYRGWQAPFNRWVAVKILAGPHGQSPAYRFDHELRALGSLSEHPHVVPVYEAGHADERAYLVMPYLTGGSLQDRMTDGPVAPAEAVAAGQAVADALAEAHRLGILHRDIKPANILFTGFGVPQLADFGVAHLSDATLTGGLLAVTVAYAAPEVLSGQAASARSDVYSLGATLYAALRGRPPFLGDRDGEEPVAQAVRVVHDDPEALTSFGVPAALAAVVERAMAKDPGARFGSATELRDALAALDPAALRPTAPAALRPTAPAAGPAGSTAAVDVPAARGGTDRPRRRRVAAAVAATLVVLAAAGTAAGLSLGGDRPRTGPTRSALKAPAPVSTTTPAATAPATAPAGAPGGSGGATQAGTTASAASPPSAGGATSPAAVPPAVLESTLRSYYALVDAHRLDQSWRWLSPAFQARIGQAYYWQFWDSISQVQVVSVSAAGGVATLTLHYVTTAGASSVETASLGFAIGSGDTLLIDTDRTAR